MGRKRVCVCVRERESGGGEGLRVDGLAVMGTGRERWTTVVY